MSDQCPKCEAAAEDYEVLRRLHLATIAHLERAEQQLAQLRERAEKLQEAAEHLANDIRYSWFLEREKGNAIMWQDIARSFSALEEFLPPAK